MAMTGSPHCPTSSAIVPPRREHEEPAMLLGYGAGAAGLLALLLALLLTGILLTGGAGATLLPAAAARDRRSPGRLSAGLGAGGLPGGVRADADRHGHPDIKSQRAEDRWNQRSYLTLDEAKPLGEITLPKEAG